MSTFVPYEMVRIGCWILLVMCVFATDPFYSHLHPCPESCVGDPARWDVSTSLGRLGTCNHPVLLDFNLYNTISSTGHMKFRSCTAQEKAFSTAITRSKDSCASSNIESFVALDVITKGPHVQTGLHDINFTSQAVSGFLSDSCDTDFIVGYLNGAVVGVYSGASIDNRATIPSILDEFIIHAGHHKTSLLQSCGQPRTADNTFGIVVDSTGNLTEIQKALQSWKSAKCVDGYQTGTQLHKLSLFEKAPPLTFQGPTNFGSQLSSTTHSENKRLFARADCTTKAVVAGDSCGSLATKCGISANDFTTYNSNSDLCSTLTPGQRVCCSLGSLPDIRPKTSQNGSCASHQVQSGDTCSSIAAHNGITVENISQYNDNSTWGWFGCDNLMAGLAICLSDGHPPLPASIPNAVCGPTKAGSKADASTALADMNPCPLNACCNIWGQCGITPEYCTVEIGPKGNPGTAPPGRNGCISNCGTSVTNNDQAPQDFKTIAYYESWNWDRPCLNMRADSIDATMYTNVHWGFATITSSFNVSVNDTFGQWSRFTSQYGVNRIVAFGGWGFSTDPNTYDILRKAMDPTNAATFADNIVNFINVNNLDGVDFDWEYPGAPDIPGVPRGLQSDGPNYLAFLKTLRGKMPSGKTISIAAPASFWYLKAFPISDMAKQLDYIVYMTYDLHGQWDYSNSWSQDGCSTGSCLRSHVNLTETNYALAMITKAGVPANMITVGLSSYGRSFGMTQAGCKGPLCTFGGLNSTASPGRCTSTSGYISNAEIYEILTINDTASSPSTWFDTDSNSDIMVYDDKQWVAFLSQDTKTSRTSYYQGLNFSGTIDWAVDLQEFGSDDGEPNVGHDLSSLPALPICDANYATLEDLDGAAGDVPDNCKSTYLVQTLSNVLTDSVAKYNDMMSNGYDQKFNTYAQSVVDSASHSVNTFVTQNGNNYFSCIVTETTTCCDHCKSNALTDSYCDYCFTGTCYQTCDSITGCSKERHTLGASINADLVESHFIQREVPQSVQQPISKVQNVSEPCPPDYSKRGEGPDNPYEQSVYWTLNDDKSDLFFADLLTNTSIPKDKIKFDNLDRGLDCAPSSQPDDPCHANGMDFNIPVPNGYSTGDVTNPKDVVQKALQNSNDLMNQVQSAAINVRLMCYGGDAFELVDSISLPVLMIAQAVDSMSQIEDVADKIEEEKRKALIMAFLGAILFFVPIAGEILGSVAELAEIGSIIALLGNVGNAAFDIYTVVDDPNNAPLAIFGLILAPLALGDLAVITKAANIRRGMNDADIAKLGDKVSSRMDTIRKVTGTCRRTT